MTAADGGRLLLAKPHLDPRYSRLCRRLAVQLCAAKRCEKAIGKRVSVVEFRAMESLIAKVEGAPSRVLLSIVVCPAVNNTRPFRVGGDRKQV